MDGTEHATEQLTGLARRERRGSEKRKVGLKNIARMLPRFPSTMADGSIPPNVFAPDLMLMSMEDSYCDSWGRTDVVSSRDRSLFTVSMMIGVGNVGNQYELGWHGPCAIYNGATLDELEAIVVHARAYVGSPASAWAKDSILKALKEHGLLDGTRPPPDVERRERTGSEKRAIGREVLREMQPGAELLNAPDDLPADVFAPELDLMILENCYFDLWTRTDVLDHRTRSIVTLGMLIGLANHAALRTHVGVALRHGVTEAELAELLYQAATYLGYPTGIAIRATLAAGIADTKQ